MSDGIEFSGKVSLEALQLLVTLQLVDPKKTIAAYLEVNGNDLNGAGFGGLINDAINTDDVPETFKPAAGKADAAANVKAQHAAPSFATPAPAEETETLEADPYDEVFKRLAALEASLIKAKKVHDNALAPAEVESVDNGNTQSVAHATPDNESETGEPDSKKADDTVEPDTDAARIAEIKESLAVTAFDTTKHKIGKQSVAVSCQLWMSPDAPLKAATAARIQRILGTVAMELMVTPQAASENSAQVTTKLGSDLEVLLDDNTLLVVHFAGKLTHSPSESADNVKQRFDNAIIELRERLIGAVANLNTGCYISISSRGTDPQQVAKAHAAATTLNK